MLNLQQGPNSLCFYNINPDTYQILSANNRLIISNGFDKKEYQADDLVSVLTGGRIEVWTVWINDSASAPFSYQNIDLPDGNYDFEFQGNGNGNPLVYETVLKGQVWLGVVTSGNPVEIIQETYISDNETSQSIIYYS